MANRGFLRPARGLTVALLFALAKPPNCRLLCSRAAAGVSRTSACRGRASGCKGKHAVVGNFAPKLRKNTKNAAPVFVRHFDVCTALVNGRVALCAAWRCRARRASGARTKGANLRFEQVNFRIFPRNFV